MSFRCSTRSVSDNGSASPNRTVRRLTRSAGTCRNHNTVVSGLPGPLVSTAFHLQIDARQVMASETQATSTRTRGAHGQSGRPVRRRSARGTGRRPARQDTTSPAQRADGEGRTRQSRLDSHSGSPLGLRLRQAAPLVIGVAMFGYFVWICLQMAPHAPGGAPLLAAILGSVAAGVFAGWVGLRGKP